MAEIQWDQIGEKVYETGVDHGVLYIPDNSGAYILGYAWNGLTTITESPSGAESNPQYADNIKYIDLTSAEEFGATVEAFTYPREFAQCDGTAIVNGVQVGQQGRRPFGLSYRTLVGNDVQGTDYGYKLHLVYGAKAAPSEKANTTINDSPEAATLSWELTTTPVPVGTIGGTTYKPTASLTIDSTDPTIDADNLAALETILYGADGVEPRLPSPAEVIALFGGAVQEVNLVAANAPTYDEGTHVVTIPAVTGVSWKVNGVDAAAGAQPALGVGESAVVTATPNSGYLITGDDDWVYNY